MIEIFIIIVIIIILLIIIRNVLKYRKYKKNIDKNLEGHHNYLESIDKSASIIKAAPKPNVVIFFLDDLGFADISCYGAKNISTPNIDNLAQNGVIFDSFYSAAPVCSPSRAGLLTGRHPLRMHIPNVFFPSRYKLIIKHLFKFYQNGVEGLLEDEITIAEALKKAGYSTGLIGKWHLGDKSPHLPNDKGFDFFYGAHYSNDMPPYAIYKNKDIDQQAPADQNNLTKSLTREALGFIEKNKENSFFLHFCHPFPHRPLHVSDDFKGTSKGGLYGDVVQEIDWSVGEVVKNLEKNYLLDKTLIFFTSDNGPWYQGNPGFHRGRKNLPYEGGQRVPMIASWLDVIPKGKLINEMASNLDFFPTILKSAGIPLPDDRIIDGKDIMPLITGETEITPHKTIFYNWSRRVLAVRDRFYKYHKKHRTDNAAYFIMRTPPMLFDMQSYDQESYDQSLHHPKEAEELRIILEHFREELKKNPRGWIRKN